ncbi:hypothetical protein HQN87_16530 [Paenibacillus tritici]|uniref:Uncharacterized protein n=1 Tax=Paenibacillus tritici TaxID=1873425 RepID=A0ABX2DQI7_9BACL|nr:hypothetical protein [Paenibacillus tritici]NQX46946.1 hypothetical protein [Paenibacillus tritici]
MLHLQNKFVSYVINKYDRPPIKILKSSDDREIERYLESIPAEAAASMDEDGTIFILLHDTIAGCAAIFEEFAHAIQYEKRGNIAINSAEVCIREIEVAECLLEYGVKLGLTQQELDQTRTNLESYKDQLLFYKEG